MTVHLDSIETLTSDEQNGVLKALTRSAIVSGLSTTDYAILDAALDSAGVPAAGDSLGSTSLVLVRRSARAAARGVVDVTLEYLVKKWDSAGWEWGCDSSLTGDTISDYEGVPLYTEYTYPYDYQIESYRNKTAMQGAAVAVSRPELQLTATGDMTIEYDHPDVMCYTWLGCVNSATWRGYGAGNVLVESMSARPIDISAKLYHFECSLRVRPGGWQPVYRFIDPNTGYPPADLVNGTGYKTLSWFPTAGFAAIWP